MLWLPTPQISQLPRPLVAALRMKKHIFKGRIYGRKYCTRCGLITARNKRTRRAVRSECKKDWILPGLVIK